MEQTITWETELEAAQQRSKDEGKVIFLDFFNPQ